ncbi:ABC transporter permease [Paenarthrobacter sp. NPDC091669]|uniref:ABC transporter permease n=1 Tax=Paenarthrobacter sp. NPDC091669 TaxID=3364384 RepID=UPI00382F61D0
MPTAVLAVLAFMAITPDLIGGIFGNGDPRSCDLGMSRSGSAPGHPFGFDVQGCDLYTNVIHGARNSLLVALMATAMAFLVALVIGTVAALFDGWADSVLSRLTDIFLGFPFVIGAIILLISFDERTAFSVALVLALFTWPLMARLVRSSVRSVRGTEFVQASTAMGIGLGRTVVRHILPNALGPVLAIVTINVGGIIVAESGLSFLGVGLDAPAISWGRQIADAQTQLANAPHLILWPGLFLALTVLSLISLGDVLRDALDPRQR